MKKIVFAIGLMAATGTMCFAQEMKASAPAAQMDRAQMQAVGKVEADKEVSRLSGPLQLTDAQKQAVYGITLKWSMMGQSGNMSKEKAQEMKEDQLKHSLSAEQFAKYKAMSSK